MRWEKDVCELEDTPVYGNRNDLSMTHAKLSK